jgi:hypothetical protein
VFGRCRAEQREVQGELGGALVEGEQLQLAMCGSTVRCWEGMPEVAVLRAERI